MIRPHSMIRGITTTMYLGVAAIGVMTVALLGAQDVQAEEKKKRIGPPPKVYTALPTECSRCHKPDGRGGPAYGGFAADLRATVMDEAGLVHIITEGVRSRGMPEFKSTMTKREIEGLATYIVDNIKGVYLDADGNRITAEEAAATDPRKNDAAAKSE